MSKERFKISGEFSDCFKIPKAIDTNIHIYTHLPVMIRHMYGYADMYGVNTSLRKKLRLSKASLGSRDRGSGSRRTDWTENT